MASSSFSPQTAVAGVHPPHNRYNAIWRVRLLFVITLCSVAAALGYVAFQKIKDAEENLAITMFNSIAARALNDVIRTTQEKRWSAVAMASVVSEMNPNAADYPFVVVNGFERMAKNLLDSR